MIKLKFFLTLVSFGLLLATSCKLQNLESQYSVENESSLVEYTLSEKDVRSFISLLNNSSIEYISLDSVDKIGDFMVKQTQKFGFTNLDHFSKVSRSILITYGIIQVEKNFYVSQKKNISNLIDYSSNLIRELSSGNLPPMERSNLERDLERIKKVISKFRIGLDTKLNPTNKLIIKEYEKDLEKFIVVGEF